MTNLLESLFTNKNVAIVGPAKYMESVYYGNEIDNHDTVVRLNRSCESIKNYSKNIGSKTDVLYSCLIEKPANAGTINVDEYINYGIKLVCVPPASNIKGISNSTSFHSLINIETVKKLNDKIPVRIIDHQFHNMLASIVDCRPNTGYVAIYDILRMKPKKLSIYGFSFYLDGFIKGVKNGIIDEQDKTEEEFAVQCFNSKRHNQKNMWNYAKISLKTIPNVNLDPILSEILNMKTLDRKYFREKIIKK